MASDQPEDPGPAADHGAGDGPPPSPPIPRSVSARRLLAVVAAVGATLWLGAQIGPSAGAGLDWAWTAIRGEPEGGSGAEGETQYYTCGMHPWVILPKPGPCPICGMDLVPLDPAKFSGEVTISPVVTQNIGVRIEEVESGPMSSSIRTVGTVEYDETRLGDVNLKVSGWIERLRVDYVGAPVRKGQPLFDLYSPELVSAQEEYLLALRSLRTVGESGGIGSGARALLESARTKLRYFDIGPEQIAELERRGAPQKTLVVRSPHGGIVIEKHAVDGMKVAPGMTAYRIADLSRVWVMATLYEHQSQHVAVGQRASMTLSYLPGQSLEGKVAYIYPYLDKRTRQINVRLEFPNPTLALKPGMYATVEFEGALTQKRVLVARSAVIDTGERQVAFVSLGGGRFQPRDVQMGGETSTGKVEILEGLEPGEMVVVSGQFLIDSEARMREALARMMRGTPAAVQPAVPDVAEAPAEVATLPAAAGAALGAALDAYMAAGEALAGDTARDIGVSARAMAGALDAAMAVEVPGRPHFWHERREAVGTRDRALALAAATTIDEARRAYAPLSEALSGLLRAAGVPAAYGTKLEELHCPMYPEGTSGSVWIQQAGTARNPYFGKVMLTCSDRRQALAVAGAQGQR